MLLILGALLHRFVYIEYYFCMTCLYLYQRASVDLLMVQANSANVLYLTELKYFFR